MQFMFIVVPLIAVAILDVRTSIGSCDNSYHVVTATSTATTATKIIKSSSNPSIIGSDDLRRSPSIRCRSRYSFNHSNNGDKYNRQNKYRQLQQLLPSQHQHQQQQQQQRQHRQTLPFMMIHNIPRGGNEDAVTNNNTDTDTTNTTTAISATNVVLRIRMMDGTIHKVSINPSQQFENDTTRITLYDILHPFLPQQVNQDLNNNNNNNNSNSNSNHNHDNSYNITLPDGSTTTIVNNMDDTASPMLIPPLSTSISKLGLKHGSLISITQSKKNTSTIVQSSTSKSKLEKTVQRFDPYPDLAKDYEAAIRKAKIRRTNQNQHGMSYASIAAIQASLHQVEPQSIGSIQRIYMCHTAATQFQRECYTANSNQHPKCKIALLLGTITTERKDMKQKARTSLSSTIESDEYCQVARVHAIWEPISSTNDDNDNNDISSTVTMLIQQQLSPSDGTTTSSNVVRVAKYLGLQPIGWIFSYSNDRTTTNNNNNGDGLPVWGNEIIIGAELQIEYMKRQQQEQQEQQLQQRKGSSTNSNNNDVIPCQFSTLAMDARTGATEAFQLSDMTVQMVAEGMFHEKRNSDDRNIKDNSNVPSSSLSSGRYISTRHPVIVDGKETNQLDSVLCLVNIALLSHNGMFTGGSTGSSGDTTLSTTTAKIRSNGKLSNKMRKAIVKAIDSIGDDNNPSKLFSIICDFSILLALDNVLIDHTDSELLCKTVYKWARGQKKSVTIDTNLKQKLRRALDSTI